MLTQHPLYKSGQIKQSCFSHIEAHLAVAFWLSQDADLPPFCYRFCGSVFPRSFGVMPHSSVISSSSHWLSGLVVASAIISFTCSCACGGAIRRTCTYLTLLCGLCVQRLYVLPLALLWGEPLLLTCGR